MLGLSFLLIVTHLAAECAVGMVVTLQLNLTSHSEPQTHFVVNMFIESCLVVGAAVAFFLGQATAYLLGGTIRRSAPLIVVFLGVAFCLGRWAVWFAARIVPFEYSEGTDAIVTLIYGACSTFAVVRWHDAVRPGKG